MIPLPAIARMGLLLLVGPVIDAVQDTVQTACVGLRIYHEVSIEILDLIEPC